MNYRVFWSPRSEERLEMFVAVSSSERSILAAAAREIDKNLLSQPNAFGESRYDNVRIGFVHPLCIQFEVIEDVRTVIVDRY
jgi:hypothetical protein